MLLNLDFKQLEFVIFTDLCQDPGLIWAINQGLDIHVESAAEVLGKDPSQVTPEERQDAKAINFGLIYGNGPKTASERTGRPQEWCKDFIDGFYERYPKSKEWHDQIQNTVNQTGQLKLWTGEVLKFRKYPAKFDWQKKQGIVESYNPPDIKNYPVQHVAALFTSILLGQFFRNKALHNRHKYLMINTVHDSLMLDCRPEFIEDAKKDLLETIDIIPQICENRFNRKLSVPIRCDITQGKRWSELS